MISPRYRCIFIHQRKCAGTSIISTFQPMSRQEKNYLNEGILSEKWEKKRHFISKHVTFCVVRNPWSRFVSGWRYCESTKGRDLKDVLRNPPSEGHDYRHLTRPQHATIVYPEGTYAVDHVLRFETLQDDFDRLCDLIGKPRTPLPKHNSGPPVEYRPLFDDEAQELFYTRFGRDIELFGYQF